MSEKSKPGRDIKVDLYSRPNATNGKYRVAQIGLDDLSEIKDSNIFFLQTLKIRADSADRIFAEAEANGKNINDPNIIKELGKEINALGKPIHQSEAIMTALFVSLQLIAYYAIAIGIWGLVFGGSFLVFGFYGAIVGLIISLLSVAPVVAYQRTKERIKDIVFGVSVLWGNFGIVIGALGVIVLIVKLIFFK